MLDLIIRVTEGVLKGSQRTTKGGVRYNSYEGIPYAQPPVGKLRFMDPQPPELWSGLWNATKPRNVSPQYNERKKKFLGSEDSLYLNIYVPITNTKPTNLPVMLYIQGGGYFKGDSNVELQRPDTLIDTGIIMITFNYRMGPLGFLCLQNSEVPGNAGLKDQVFAMRWVRNNIETFGGDPNNVTIMGESIGAVYVNYHMVSAMSRRLFAKAIIQSGSCLAVWAHQNNAEKNAFNLAAKLGLNTSNILVALEFLQTVPAEDLVMATRVEVRYDMEVLFGCVVEDRYPGVEPFITAPPMEMMKSPNNNIVPCIVGLCTYEAMIFLTPEVLEIEADKFHLSHDKLKQLLKKNNAFDATPEELEKFHNFYFTNKQNPFKAFMRLMSDIMFVRYVTKSIQTLRQFNKRVFFYIFGFRGKANKQQPGTQFPYPGAGHGDEMYYLFRRMEENYKLDAFDSLTRKRLVSLWSNFAISGDPTPVVDDEISTFWKPVDEDMMHCLKFKKAMEMIKNPYSDRLAFLEKFFERQTE